MRLECTYIKYGRNFYCQTFPSFISLYLSNGTCLLLLPRFCYAEILGLALFVLWLRWSLYQSVKVLIVTAVLPHAHTDLLIFFLSEYSLMDWYLCLSEMFARSLWPDFHMRTKKNKSRSHCFCVTRSCDSWLFIKAPCCFSVCLPVCRRLMPSIEMPLLTHVHILSLSCRLQPVVFSCLVFIQGTLGR